MSEGEAEVRCHPPSVVRAKEFLQRGMGLSEPEAHRVLQLFASSLQVRMADAGETICRLVKSVGSVVGRR